MNYEGKALTIAGSDSSGGAGIQADLKTFQVFNVYGMSVITSITAQNTLGVKAIHDVPEEVVALQIDAVLEDIGTDAVKTGMLSNANIIDVVSEKVKQYKIEKLVIDPVMVAKSGVRLLRVDAERALVTKLIPLSFLVTPNVFETEIIAGVKIGSPESMKEACKIIYDLGAKNVLVKGGDLEGEKSSDILFDGKDFYTFEEKRINTKNTHGTGCTLSAAICAELAKGRDVVTAVKIAKDFITQAIREAPDNVGKGFGPLYHNVKIKGVL
jgi:hydroxymethylpyrimidine/phosphomethylpyrimidine kinase